MIGAVQRILSKLLAIALLAGVTLFAYALIIEPVAARFRDVREHITEQRQLLGRLTATATQDGEARVIERLAKQQTGGMIYLPGSSDAVRVAELQSLIGKITEAEGVAIRSTRAVPPRERDGLRLLGVEVQMSASVEQLQRILQALETGRPYLFVETLQVSPPPLLSADNQSAGTALEVRLGLLGLATAKKG